jgi:hypothetical protein
MRTFLLVVLAAFVASMLASLFAYLGNSYVPAGLLHDWFFELPAALYGLFGGADTEIGKALLMFCIYFMQHMAGLLILWAVLHVVRALIRCASDLQHGLPGTIRR